MKIKKSDSRGIQRKAAAKLPTRQERKIKLVPIEVEKEKELKWLHQFILQNYDVPHFILPTLEDLKTKSRRFFRAVVVSPAARRAEIVGISGYEVRTPYLVETQKTIISKEHRGGGWGTAVSMAIEKQVEKSGFHKVRSCIYHDNFAMIQIKLAQGYIVEGFHRDHDGPGLHEYSLGKILRKKKN